MEASNRFKLLTDADDCSFHLACGINTLGAIHAAMEEGPFPADAFVDALYFVWLQLGKYQQDLQDAINKLYKE